MATGRTAGPFWKRRFFMAFFKGSIRSQTLGMDTGLTVVLPFDRAAVPETECPAIYLLHGHGENADVWTRMTSAERYANAYGVALVMPGGTAQLYTDMAHGPFLFYLCYRGTARCLSASVSHQQPQGEPFCSPAFHGRLRRSQTGAAPS